MYLRVDLLVSAGSGPFSQLSVAGQQRNVVQKPLSHLDLVRAIYIVDLEHVAALWNDWEGFERFISSVVLSDGRHAGYTNRTLYLIQTYLAAMENKGQFMALGKRSKVVHEIVVSAKQVAGERTGNDEPPSSRDLLYCVCAHQPDLSRALQESGLDLGKLVTSVRRQS